MIQSVQFSKTSKVLSVDRICYIGRLFFKEKVGIISKTNEFIDLILEAGTYHSNLNFLKFLESCVDIIKQNMI